MRRTPTRHIVVRFGAAALIVAIASTPAPAMAWGTQGHEAIAIVADRSLTAATRTRVNEILALEPGATLVSIASWADQAKDRSTSAWHYVNFPRGSDCVYKPSRDCPNGQCVVAAIATQVHLLATSTGTDQLEALKFVVHLVGDVHQPLHAGFADDRGGNTYQLQAFGRGTNAHDLWDRWMLRHIASSATSLADISSARWPLATVSLEFAPAAWATESCRIASRADFYPGRELDATYLQTFEPVAEERINLAGLRLAVILNSVFGNASIR